MRKLKAFSVLLLSVVLTIGLLGCVAKDNGTKTSTATAETNQKVTNTNSNIATETFTVGFLGPLTGTNADLGVRPLAALEILTDNVNAKGGVKLANGKSVKLQLIKENDNGTVDGTVSAMKKLIEVKKVGAVIGGMLSSPVLSAMDIAENQSVPFVITGAISNGIGKKIAEKGYKYVFQSAPTSTARASADIQAISELIHPKSMTIIAQETDWGRDMAAAAQEFITKNNSDIKATIEFVPQGTTSYSSQLLKIQNNKPDLIYALLIGQELFSFMDQKDSTGDKTVVFGGSSTPASDIYIKTIGVKKSNYTLANIVWTPAIGGEAGKAFTEEYKTKTKNSPADIEAQAYDGMLMLINTLEKASSISRSDVANALVNASVDGLRGKNVFDPKSHTTPNLNFVISQIIDGKYVDIWPSQFAKGQFVKP